MHLSESVSYFASQFILCLYTLSVCDEPMEVLLVLEGHGIGTALSMGPLLGGQEQSPAWQNKLAAGGQYETLMPARLLLALRKQNSCPA